MFGKINISEIFVNKDNMNDAYNKRLNSKNKVSKTKNPLEIFMMLDDSKFLMDGHHRLADYIININDKNEILNLKMSANILKTPTENYKIALDSNLYHGYILFKDWLKDNLTI